MAEVFDINDSYTNTELVRMAVQTEQETGEYVGPQIAPLKPTQVNKVKKGRIEILGVGAAQVVAKHAAPAIFVPQIDYSEEWIELVKLDEMSPIEEDEWDKLTSGNDYERNMVGVDIVNRSRLLQMRFETKTEIMRWAAFHDSLTLTFAESGATAPTLSYTFGQNVLNRPDLSDWNNRSTSTPIADMRAMQKIPKTSLNKWGLTFYMGSDDFENVQYSDEVQAAINPYHGDEYKIPTKRQIEALLYGGEVDDRIDVAKGRVRIEVTDASYRAEGVAGRTSADHTLFLPKNYVMCVTQGTVNGHNIAEVLDGRVAVKPNPTALPQWRQGMQSETLISQTPPYTQYVRQVCKRIPNINEPDAIVYAYVGT